MFYIDSVCWCISSSLYLPQLAGVPLCTGTGYAIYLESMQKLCADICPAIFSSLRKGSCFQHGCFLLDIRNAPVYSPIYDLTESSRKHMWLKLSMCTTRGFLAYFWLLWMSLIKFLNLNIFSQIGMSYKFLQDPVSRIASSFTAVENCFRWQFSETTVKGVKCVAASFYTSKKL